jgi:hypothetical protein
MIKGVLVSIAAAGMACCAYAQNYYTTPEQAQTTPPPPPPPMEDRWHLYHAGEFSIDGFGLGALHEYDFNNGVRARHDLRWGGGAGINFFFTRYIGIGGDAYAIGQPHTHSFVDTTTGNLIFRVPILNTGIAPYIFGGAGYQFQGIDQIVGGGGAGVEFRLVPHFSIFVDARYLAAVKTPDYGLGRAGVRISF